MEGNYNHYCVDCGSYSIEFLSVNNGVFICRACANQHTTLGNKYSYIQSIDQGINVYYDMFSQRGGNLRFTTFIENFNLDQMDINLKYKTKAVNYYRKLIYSEVFCEDPPKLITYNEGIKLIEDNEVQEFDLESLKKVEVHDYDQMIKEKKGIMGSVIDFIDNMKEDSFEKEDYFDNNDQMYKNNDSQMNYPCAELPKK